jgi:hypothetical protein
MQRLLLVLPDLSSLAVFDDVSGEVVGSVPRGSRRDGNGYRVEDTWVAMYAEEGALILQVGRRRFSLDAASTKLQYWHDWATGRTNFGVRDPAGEVVLGYQSWWAKLGIPPQRVKFEPERDEYEDFLAFVYEVWRDPVAQQRLLAQWE